VHWTAPWGGTYNNATGTLLSETAADQTQCRVKHEIAQTRGTRQTSLGDFALDGSWVQATWSGCQVNGTPWAATTTDQSATGFNAPANQGDSIYDKLYKGTKTPGSSTIVEFTNLPANVTNATARGGPANDPNFPGRYTNETCVIHLGTATRPIGDTVG